MNVELTYCICKSIKLKYRDPNNHGICINMQYVAGKLFGTFDNRSEFSSRQKST